MQVRTSAKQVNSRGETRSHESKSNDVVDGREGRGFGRERKLVGPTLSRSGSF